MHDLTNNVCSFLLIKCENPEFMKVLEYFIFSIYNIWSLFKFQKGYITVPRSRTASLQTTASISYNNK